MDNDSPDLDESPDLIEENLPKKPENIIDFPNVPQDPQNPERLRDFYISESIERYSIDFLGTLNDDSVNVGEEFNKWKERKLNDILESFRSGSDLQGNPHMSQSALELYDIVIKSMDLKSLLDFADGRIEFEQALLAKTTNEGHRAIRQSTLEYWQKRAEIVRKAIENTEK